MDKSTKEENQFPRIKAVFPVEIKIRDSSGGISSSILGETTDLSRDGAMVKVKSRLPNSSTVSLHINSSLGQPTVIAEAQLVKDGASSDGYFYYQLRFTEIKEDNVLNLRRLLGYEVDHIVTASYLPEKVVTNEDIVKMGFKGSPIALERKLGVKERRAVAQGETNADMLVKVAKKILDKAGLLPQELDRIICAADPGDSAAPDTACAVQGKIGATCPAFGISMSCSGWIAGVDIALGCFERGEKNILVLASSIVGSTLNYYNLMHRAIFGDGAGGILLESHHKNKFLASKLWTKGEFYSKIYVPYRWSSPPDDIPKEYKDSFYMYEDQRFFFSVIDNDMMPFAKRAFDKTKLKIEDIDLFLLHYPSKPLFDHSLEVSGIPKEKTFDRFKYYGNLVAAEMPVFLDEATKMGKVKDGDLIYILVYGAGITAGELIIRY